MARFIGQEDWLSIQARLQFAAEHLSLPAIDDAFLLPLFFQSRNQAP